MPEPSIDGLLAHSRWVNALAASLARDPGLADDLVQEAWVQVLRRGPKDDRSPRGWLATILRRQLRQMRRGDERRLAREQSRARELAEASTAEVVERAELHRSLVQAVLDLREPFRTTVLLRYLEEHTPEEIASLTAVPVATVHSRLGRGLAALRARLGRKHDERSGLFGAWLWLRVGQPRRVTRLLRQELFPLAVLGAVPVLAGSLVAYAVFDDEPRGVPATVGRVEHLDESATPLTAVGPRSGLSSARLSLEVPPLQEVLTADVVDRLGQPVAGVSVALVEEGGAARVLFEGRSLADGRVRVPVPPGRAFLRSNDARYESALAAQVLPWSTREPTLVVAPRISVAGHVVDDEGVPIADAAVRLWIDPYIPVAHARPLDSSGPVLDLVTTDAHGAFAFPSVAALEEAAFTVYRPGYPERIFGVPLESRTDLELVLPRPRDVPCVRGRVRDGFGRPAAGAWVAAHPLWTRADEEGRFELLFGTLPAERRLVAVLAGEGSGSIELPPPPQDPAGYPPWVELELEHVERALEGSVVDESGQPVAGARVWLADPTPAGQELAGVTSIETLRIGAAKRGWYWVECDARGAFRLPGVFARDYLVRAADPRTLVAGAATGAPGAPIEIRLREELTEVPLRGRVVDERGTPLADVRVAVVRPLFRSEAGSEPVEEFMQLPTLTDAHGRFELPRVSREGTRLDIRADGILPMGFALGERQPAQPFDLEVSTRAYLRVELREPHERADAIALEDGNGRTRFLALQRAWCPHLYPRAPLVDGRSLVFTASMEATTVIFYRDEEEVGRAPLALRAGELTVLRW